MADSEPGPFRAAILRSFPHLADSTFRLVTGGWDSVAVDVNDRLIFKFPRDETAKRALLKEAALLALIRPAVSMAVPDMTIHEGPPLFSSHGKLKGEHLLAPDYEKLDEGARRRLGDDLGRFYAELHRLDIGRMTAAGAASTPAWRTPEQIRARALPLLPPELRDPAERTVSAFERLPPDPYGKAYGFFDGHGWNMAFDHEHGRLEGIYDFADSGIGPLHEDFIYSNFICPDLTARIVATYERLTGRALDRLRIAILTGVHRLSELAELSDQPEHVPEMVRHAADWFASG